MITLIREKRDGAPICSAAPSLFALSAKLGLGERGTQGVVRDARDSGISLEREAAA